MAGHAPLLRSNKLTPQEIDLHNHAYILNFLNSTPVATQCDISGSVKATVCQFLMNFRIEINRIANKADNGMTISPKNIMQAQIIILRECIIDLEAYRDRLTKGVTKQ